MSTPDLCPCGCGLSASFARGLDRMLGLESAATDPSMSKENV